MEGGEQQHREGMDEKGRGKKMDRGDWKEVCGEQRSVNYVYAALLVTDRVIRRQGTAIGRVRPSICFHSTF